MNKPDYDEAVRAACNKMGAPDTGFGCMHPWCLCTHEPREPDTRGEANPNPNPSGKP